MAKTKPTQADSGGSYTLRRDRHQEFRRTVNYKSGVSAQLVFQPGEHLELTAEEVAGIKADIEAGMIVPSFRDDKGRQMIARQVAVEASAAIANLEKKIEDLSAENAQLRADLEKLTAPE